MLCCFNYKNFFLPLYKQILMQMLQRCEVQNISGMELSIQQANYYKTVIGIKISQVTMCTVVPQKRVHYGKRT